jgi:hypothetical protein
MTSRTRLCTLVLAAMVSPTVLTALVGLAHAAPAATSTTTADRKSCAAGGGYWDDVRPNDDSAVEPFHLTLPAQRHTSAPAACPGASASDVAPGHDHHDRANVAVGRPQERRIR